jgi:hypothetical protein
MFSDFFFFKKSGEILTFFKILLDISNRIQYNSGKFEAKSGTKGRKVVNFQCREISRPSEGLRDQGWR